MAKRTKTEPKIQEGVTYGERKHVRTDRSNAYGDWEFYTQSFSFEGQWSQERQLEMSRAFGKVMQHARIEKVEILAEGQGRGVVHFSKYFSLGD